TSAEQPSSMLATSPTQNEPRQLASPATTAASGMRKISGARPCGCIHHVGLPMVWTASARANSPAQIAAQPSTNSQRQPEVSCPGRRKASGLRSAAGPGACTSDGAGGDDGGAGGGGIGTIRPDVTGPTPPGRSPVALARLRSQAMDQVDHVVIGAGAMG